MKIAIVGSREPGNINFAKELEKRINIQSGDTIISGGAKGIDSLAAEYATAHGLALVEIRPDYAKNGRGATFIRNREIVDNADMVVAFWNGTSKGTKYTIDYANKKGVTTLIIAI
ncbi:SLOG family protein [Parabacteroides distasonis]